MVVSQLLGARARASPKSTPMLAGGLLAGVLLVGGYWPVTVIVGLAYFLVLRLDRGVVNNDLFYRGVV